MKILEARGEYVAGNEIFDRYIRGYKISEIVVLGACLKKEVLKIEFLGYTKNT